MDEYSRFPLCFPRPDMLSSTVIKFWDLLFALRGNPNHVHSDLGRSFKDYFLQGVAIGRARKLNIIIGFCGKRQVVS